MTTHCCRGRRGWLLLVCVMLGAAVGSAAEVAPVGGEELTGRMTDLVLQLGVILLAAKVGGAICRRWLRLPDVLGELGAGILIGPYLLGPHIGLFHPVAAGTGMPVSPELYGIATVASVLLLYLAGLETDLGMFLSYSVVGSAVGVGGVVLSFGLGNAVAVWTGLAPAGYMSPPALFLGAISTATSVGITARVLSQRNRIDSPEGVTILAGAVVDDVLGIVVLAVVVGICRQGQSAAGVDWGSIAAIAAKATLFWLVCTGLGLLLAKKISKVLEWFGSAQVMATLSLGLALMLAGLAEKANLAMIIGAYIMGLSLSRADAAHELRDRLQPVCDTLVAVFFTVMGMMVNLQKVGAVLGVGLIFTAAGIVAKLVGCGVPAWLTRFRWKGALRVGVGMLPRGEVTLLMAGVGLAGGFITDEVFGVAVLMTLVCTLFAPILMVRLFDDEIGVREGKKGDTPVKTDPISLPVPNQEVAEFLIARILRMFQQEECYCHKLARDEHLYQIRKDDMMLMLTYKSGSLDIRCEDADRDFARLILLEALATLVTVFDGLRDMQSSDLRSRIG